MRTKIYNGCLITAMSLGILLPVTVAATKSITGLQASNEKTISLSFPVENDTVSILKPKVEQYIAAMHEQAKQIQADDYTLHQGFYTVAPDMASHYYGTDFRGSDFPNDLVDIANYASNSFNYSKSKEITLVFKSKGFAAGTEFTVKYGMNANLEDAKTVTTTETYATINNLYSNRTYYWQVSADGVSSSIETFKTADGFRMITADGINNVRDMGGRPVSGGKHIKQGLIYRGGELVAETYVDSRDGKTHYQTLTPENKKIFQEDLGIKLEIDFRGDEESNNLVESDLKDAEHNDIEYMRIANLSAYDYFYTMSSSKVDSQERKYWDMVKTMFMAFKNANEKPVYFHCWGGADRTGTIGFLLGGLLGMSYTDLIIDFELTSFSRNFRCHYANDVEKVYYFPTMIRQILELTNKQGDKYWSATKPIAQILEEILIDKAGLTAQDIIDIRSALLE